MADMKLAPSPALFFAAIFVLSASLAAQTESAGESISTRIDRVFSAYQKADCPGCAIGVSLNGRVVLTRGYGLANLEYSVPIKPDTIFEAGSCSKQFTVAAALLLAKQGKLSLEDDIRKYIPEAPDFGEKITIRNLMNHTSGLRDQWTLLSIAGRPPGEAVHTLAEILYLVSRQRELNFRTGTEYLYSNTGYALLNWIVRRAGGRTLADFSQTEIFKPLAMSRTQWREDYSRIVKGRATAYSLDREGKYHTNMSFTNVYGNGGLLTTVGDLLVWNENLDRPRVLGPEIVQEMQTRSRLSGGQEIVYGLGMEVGEYKGLREICHAGSTAGYKAFLTRFPDQRLSIAILCNSSNSNPEMLAHQVAEVILAGRWKEKPKPDRLDVPASELKRYTGLYRNMTTDSVLRLVIVKENLAVAGSGPGGRSLIPTGPGRFESADRTSYEFESGENGTPLQLRVSPYLDLPALWTAVPQANPTPQKISEYVGTYFSQELGVFYEIAVREGKLLIQHLPEPATVLEPGYEDAFGTASYVVRFTRNNAGKVDGLRMYAGRVRHLRFQRQPDRQRGP
jgi:CubicO group peptidase (beta-lactamase class C family)